MSFHTWLKGHFKLDSQDLAEISNSIVPGLDDIDDIDVLALLADEDMPNACDQPPPAAAAAADGFALDGMLDGLSQSGGHASSNAVLAGNMSSNLGSNLGSNFGAGQHGQPAALGHAAFMLPAPANGTSVSATTLLPVYQQQQAVQPSMLLQQQQQQQQQQFLQATANDILQQRQQQQQQQQALLLPAQQPSFEYLLQSQQQLQPPLQPQPQGLQLDMNSSWSNSRSLQPPASLSQPPTQQQLLSPMSNNNSNIGTAMLANPALPAPAAPRPAAACSKAAAAATAAAATQGGARPASNPAARRGAAAVSGSSSDAAKDKAPGPKRYRKPSDAQRAAHKRFRERRKEQLVHLEQEVAAKKAQLQAAQLENTALTAKARALDQLVASACESTELLQHLERLTLSEQQQQQQLEAPTLQEIISPSHAAGAGAAGAARGHAFAPAGLITRQSSSPLGTPDAAASAAAPSAIGPAAGTSLLRPASAAGPKPSSGNAVSSAAQADRDSHPQQQQQQQGLGRSQHELLQLEQQEKQEWQLLFRSVQPRAPLETVQRSSSSSGGSPLGSRARAGSIGRLEEALVRLLPGKCPELPGRAMQLEPGMQGALSQLQALLKSFAGELMQLLLQVGREEQQVAAAAAAATWQLAAPQQQLQLQACPTAGCNSGSDAATPAMARLKYLLGQGQAEWRAFAVSNRISVYALNTLNIESGVLGHAPPPGHWTKVAAVLGERLEPQVLQDMCVARQLYSKAITQVKQQRHMLVLQLQHMMSRYSELDVYGQTDRVVTDLDGPHVQGQALLDAIDSNMRREFVLEGVYKWAFHRLLPPLMAAEILVHSYPFLPDCHGILDELSSSSGPPLSVSSHLLQLQEQVAEHLQQQPQQFLAGTAV